ncbi:hypothetical protein BGZ65_002933 [Modicella reniformis]|uniref:Uncharacterized protein n=1 Tax=Modicella reniformis TaxID=1440133 RepID=A0A9P6M2V5_9FUNG|nr:hypothetical protein BGZ65_002933 [Modicella reniformis]
MLSGGYLLNQLQHQKDVPLTAPLTEGDHANMDIPLDPGSGPRRDRNRGKKQQPPKKETLKGQTGKGKPPAGKGKVTPGDPNEATKGTVKDDSTGAGPKGDNKPSPDDHSHQGLRICNLEDVTHGRWIYSEKRGGVPQWSPGQDLSWTGYGHNGCRSSIWNERYLLTPFLASDPTTPANKTLSQMDQEYAWNLKGYHWQIDHKQDKQEKHQEAQNQEDCWQPSMDVEDFIEILRRAPLIMIGDKFLEQEYLSIECIIMGMQDQLVLEYQTENNGAVTEEEAMDSLEYRIKSNMPPIVELKIAPGSVNSELSRTGNHTADATSNHSNVYRKAKPGEMRLVDRVSNLTLMAFVRSDVLWDSGMLAGLVTKHALKSVTELSVLDASGLHPDSRIDGHVAGSRSVEETRLHWWQWLLGTKETALESTINGRDSSANHNEEDMFFGSDLEHDMINLEWVQSLEDIVRNSVAQQKSASQRQESIDGDIERKPVVVISNGYFWEYDSQDVISLLQRDGGRKLSKAEQEEIKNTQDKRRKLSCDAAPMDAASEALKEMKDQEAALLNALTKTVVARMQDPLYSFLDTMFLQSFHDPRANNRHCNNFMMPGPLDTLVHHLYGELYRLDL